MRNVRIAVLVAGSTLVALTALAGAAPPADPAAPPEHVEVNASATCDGCHAEVTPEIRAAWFSGAHGLNNVKCFVCHGDTTERFTVQVGMERCGGCHAEKLRSMEQADLTGKTCFSCHPPHRLSPHRLALPGSAGQSGETPEEGGRP